MSAATGAAPAQGGPPSLDALERAAKKDQAPAKEKPDPEREAKIVALNRISLVLTMAQTMQSAMYPMLTMSVLKSQAEAASLLGSLQATSSLVQVLLGPTVGALGDAIGRKPLLLAAAAAVTSSRFYAAFGPKTRRMLILTNVIAGCAGDFFYKAVDASTAVLAKDKKEVAMLKARDSKFKGYAMMLGPYLAAFLTTKFGPRTAFAVSGAVGAASFAQVATTFECKAALKPFKPSPGKLLGALRMFESKDMFLLAALSMLVDVPLRTGPIFQLNTKHRFGWTAETTGRWTLLYAFGVPFAMSQQKKILQLGEQKAMNLLTGASFAAIMCLTLSKKGKLFWASLVFFLIGLGKPNLVRSIVQSEARDRMPDIGPGELQGILGSVVNVASMLSTKLHSSAYAYFVSDRAPFQWPAVPFAICGLSDVAVLALYHSTRQHQKAA